MTDQCIHVAPSPGQSMCQCRHMQIELEFAIRIIDRAAAERARRCGDRMDRMTCTLPTGHSGAHVDETVFGKARR